MLKKSIVSRALQMAENFRGSDLRVTFSPSSPMSGLAQLCQPELAIGGTALGLPDVDTIATNSEFLADGEIRSAHTRAIGQTVATLTAAVRSHMDLVRNVVKPLMKDYSEGLFLALRDLPSVADFNPKLISFELPELLRHPAYTGDIERRRVGEVGNFPYEMIAPYPGYDEVVKMITVGDSALDAGLLGWLEQTVENGQSQQLENLWAAIFNVPGDHADMRRWLSGEIGRAHV